MRDTFTDTLAAADAASLSEGVAERDRPTLAELEGIADDYYTFRAALRWVDGSLFVDTQLASDDDADF